MHDEHLGVGLRRRLGAANFDQWHSFDHGTFPATRTAAASRPFAHLLTVRLHTVAALNRGER